MIMSTFLKFFLSKFIFLAIFFYFSDFWAKNLWTIPEIEILRPNGMRVNKIWGNLKSYFRPFGQNFHF